MRAVFPALIIGCLCAAVSLHAETVRVGAYDFPPYFKMDGKDANSVQGAIVDLVAAFDQLDETHQYQIVATSPRRRYDDIKQARVDVMMFEDMSWGWSGQDIEITQPFLEGGEIYITRAVPGRGQEYFENLADRSIAGYLGYHYGFAQFESDPEVIKKRFKIVFSSRHETNIRLALEGRIDVAVVTDAFLNGYFRNNPEDRSRLLVSDKRDQDYHHVIICRPKGPLGCAQAQTFLDQMKQSGALAQLAEKWGLPKP